MPVLKGFIWIKGINTCQGLRAAAHVSPIELLAVVTPWFLNKPERSLIRCLVGSSGKSLHGETVDF